ncbi:hypothetical protein CLOM_g20033 [Closterium sp. NIES-68]|nr:hypothetical protein CLOM_g20033 [Closterium sp. NIES-68]GJP83067.1 hypothetical protein CLOP_g13277 [Closterium sp. NIES-67]
MKTSVLLLVLVALAASLHLASAQSSSTYNSTCNNFCTASGNNSIYLNCTMQCVNCISKAPSGCIPFFNPVFTGGMLQNCECGFSCHASLAWWQWMLVGFAIFFACAMVGACIMYGTKGAE